MLLKSIGQILIQRPVLGMRLLRDALFDRMGFHRESPEVHLLDLLRFTARTGWTQQFVPGGYLEVRASAGENPFRYRLRTGDSDIRVFREVIVHEAYREALSALGKVRQDPWIVDAGANIGLSTLYLKQHFPSARVVALEPDEDNAAQIQWHLSTNRCDGVSVVRAALWPERTKLRFIGSGEPTLSWGLRVEAGPEGNINALSPADLIAEYGMDQIDLLKMDVEGSEFPLFADPKAIQWISRVRVIIAEIHPDLGDPEAILGVLRGAGFEVRPLGGDVYLARRCEAVPGAGGV